MRWAWRQAARSLSLWCPLLPATSCRNSRGPALDFDSRLGGGTPDSVLRSCSSGRWRVGLFLHLVDPGAPPARLPACE
ncbi:hypothetical protein LZ31DRAFT_556869 [Colletotrichum somersetense]|nr:hypothetical protein LZ31DRAFT_556869 [Colletotrichum somersetense]